MSLLSRLFSRPSDPKLALRPLYTAVIARSRDVRWYEAGIPDTLDGRFEVITAILSHVLLRLEQEGGDVATLATHLTELFVDDMDGQLRQIGIGDLMVGKHVGKMMAALGGRLGGYRSASSAEERAAVMHRNLWPAALESKAEKAASAVAGAFLTKFADALAEQSVATLIEGILPDIAA